MHSLALTYVTTFGHSKINQTQFFTQTQFGTVFFSRIWFLEEEKTPSQMDVAPLRYTWIGLEWDGNLWVG